MSRVLVPLANGFEELEAVTIVDVLRRGGVEVVTASIHDTVEVKGAQGVRMTADALFDKVAAATYDAIVLPGGGEGTKELRRSVKVLDRLRRQRDEKHLLCAICAAPTVLVEADVLGPETHVTCYPTCQLDLDREWSPSAVVSDGLVITGQAPGSALLFALVVLKELVGEPTMQRVARGMVTDVLD